MTVRPWDVVPRGRVVAAGVVIDPAVVGEGAARRRVLALWRDGDRLEAAGDRWVLRFDRPRAVDALGPGLPVVGRGAALVGLPLREAEWAERPAEAVLLARGGVLVGVDPGPSLDPSAWIGLDAPVVRVRGLGPPPAPPRAAAAAPPLTRGAFGVGEEASSVAALRALLAGEVPPEPDPPPPREPGWLDRVIGWLRGPPSDAGAPDGASDGPGSAPVAGAAGPFAGLAAFLERFAASGLQNLGMGDAIAKRQAMTLEALLARFDGDLDEALRHAIPLGGDGPGGASPRHPALRAPPPRGALAPSLAGGGAAAGSSFGAAPSMYEALKAKYLASAQALEAAGQIEKAAFVHSDLLHDVKAAVDLLERHGRYGLAARLHVARGFGAPERAVRLYALAGEIGPAVQLAHATGAFAAAVAQLEGEPGARRGLRAAWAATLVAAGRRAAAVDALWPEVELRKAALPWLRALVEAGGEAAAGALPRLRELDPEAAEVAFERLISSLDDDDAAGRRALALRVAADGGPEGWTRPLARALLADATRPDRGFEGAEAFRRLVAAPSLADLKVDAPIFPAAPPAPTGPLVIDDEPGTTPILDAVRLANGTALALGEAGVAWLDRDGRVAWRDPGPIRHLVADPEANVVYGLWPVDRANVRVVRLDPSARAARTWATLALIGWADTFLAGRWLVAAPDRELLLDLTAPEPTWLWKGPEREGRGVRALFAHREGFAVARTEPDELWHYTPAMVHRRHEPMEAGHPIRATADQILVLTKGAGPIWTLGGAATVLETAAGGSWGGQAVYDGRVLDLALLPGRAVVARPLGRSGGVQLAVHVGQQVVGRVELPRAPTVGLRADGAAVAVWDPLGRAAWFDPQTMRVLRRVRV